MFVDLSWNILILILSALDSSVSVVINKNGYCCFRRNIHYMFWKSTVPSGFGEIRLRLCDVSYTTLLIYQLFILYPYIRISAYKILVFKSNGDGQEIHVWKYLKTVDFINTKINMFKINLFYPIEYRRRIRNYVILKMKVNAILNQWHLQTIEWTISDSFEIYESIRQSICNVTRPWLYLPLPICINCRALAWEGNVYKLAFFFWLSPRTYHFLFEKRLIIAWRYYWRSIALSLM